MPQECWERSCFLAGKLKDNFPSQRRWHFIRTLKEGWVSVDGEEQRAFQIKSFHWAHLSVSSAWWAHCTWVSTSCTCKQLMRRNRCRLELQPKGKPRSQGRGFFFFFNLLTLRINHVSDQRGKNKQRGRNSKRKAGACSLICQDRFSFRSYFSRLFAFQFLLCIYKLALPKVAFLACHLKWGCDSGPRLRPQCHYCLQLLKIQALAFVSPFLSFFHCTPHFPSSLLLKLLFPVVNVNGCC